MYTSNEGTSQMTLQNNSERCRLLPHDVEGGVPKSELGFSDATIRANFFRKVFFMVSMMLGVAAIMTAIPFIHVPTMMFIRQSTGQWLHLLSYIIFLVVYIVLLWSEKARRTYPYNIISVSTLALSIGYMTMMISACYNLESVLICLLITTACCVGITAFSMQTRYDFTSLLGYLFAASMLLFVFGLISVVSIFFLHVRLLYLIYGGLAALLFMVYLAVDVQLVMGGRKFEISPEDYVFAAILIFLDIMYIFWMLLRVFGGIRVSKAHRDHLYITSVHKLPSPDLIFSDNFHISARIESYS